MTALWDEKLFGLVFGPSERAVILRRGSAERIAVHPRLLRPWRESDPFVASRLRMTRKALGYILLRSNRRQRIYTRRSGRREIRRAQRDDAKQQRHRRIGHEISRLHAIEQ